MNEKQYQIFDSDNHFYEQEDAFTRYVDKKMQSRCIQWVEINNKKKVLIGGVLNNYIKDPSFEFVPKPGAIYEYTYGFNPNNLSVRDIISSSMLPKNESFHSFYLKDKKNQMKKMNIDKTIMYSTYGLIIENFLYQDKEALYTTLMAFSKWILDEWGFADESIFTAAPVSLVDPIQAIKHLEFLLENKIKIINISPTFVPRENGGTSVSNSIYDDFWKIINDNKIVVGLHENDSWNIRFSKYWSNDITNSFNLDSEKLGILISNNNFNDFFAKLLIDNFFEKFPDVNFITSESGSSWVEPLFQKLDLANKQNKNIFKNDPIETFKSNIFVSPFAHEDIFKLKDLIGYKNILFSSDFPHVEGSCYPEIFISSIKNMNQEEIKSILYNNINNLINFY